MPNTEIKVKLRIVASWQCLECGAVNIESALHYRGGAVFTDHDELVCAGCEQGFAGGMVSQRLDEDD